MSGASVATTTLVGGGEPATRSDTAIAQIAEPTPGLMALATMPEAEFKRRLALMKAGRERIAIIQREIMTEGTDYGTVPGTKKPTLLKPGSETLAKMNGVVPTFDFVKTMGDDERTPMIEIVARCFLHMETSEGPVVGEGVGASNSFERKYRYRSAQRTCPACSAEGTIRRSRYPDRDSRDGSKGWYCHDKAGGCGAQFRANDPAIIEQEGGQVDNPDPFDVENTLYKMAAKRAQVDAVLRYTATSGIFTQDVEDGAPAEEPATTTKQATGGPQPAQETRSAPGPASTSSPAKGTGNGNGNGHAAPTERAKLSTAIVQAFWTYVRDQNFDPNAVAIHIRDKYRVAKTEDLTADQLAEVRKWVHDGGDPGREPGAEG